MRECKFILPDTNASLHADLEAALIAQFGGYTFTKAFGGWDGPDGIVQEPVRVYTVAVKTCGRSYYKLLFLARRYAIKFSQQALYFVSEYGDVEITDL